MKILRVRRGYTTNSSGGNEWVPPANTQYNEGAGQGATPQKPVVHTSQDRQDANTLAQEKHVTILAAQPSAAAPEQTPSPARAAASQPATTQPVRPDPASSRSSTNLGLAGVLLGGVVALFAVTGLVRRFWGKKK